jgi:cyclic pyranopterin phosphate synthase
MSWHEVMMDKHGRRMRKLRISLLDACNMRCSYCMPEHPHFMPQADWASADELVNIASQLCALGIEEIRLTGGEPTLRPDMMAIAQGLSALPLQKLGLTSNGLLLGDKLEALAQTNCRYLNISLDSLNADTFRRITRRDGMQTVLSTILRAREMGFHVKVNVVALRGLNDHEALDFIDWSGRESIPVRFLEVMNIGVMQAQFKERFIPASEMIAGIRKHYILTPQHDAVDATAYTFHADNGANIGFIASESEPFCGGCSRLRLTPQGHIRPCLFKDSGIDLKPLAFAEYPTALASVIRMKPAGRIEHITQPMHQIGG